MTGRDVASLLAQVAAAKGETVCDLLITNVRVVDVYTERVYAGELLVHDGRIVCLDPPRAIRAKCVFDGQGMYALPGFIDAHMHIESTLLTPEALGAAIVPHGTTAVFADGMEIANVAGVSGLIALTGTRDRLPYHLYLQVPSRVPTAPGLETTGGSLGLAETERALAGEAAVSLGEMDPAKILDRQEEYIAKVVLARCRGLVANGHGAGLGWHELNAYACAGLADDHECTRFSELEERLRVGMAVMVREGSSERNLEELLRGVVDSHLPTTRLMFCTDDKHVNDILREGHLDWNVNRAISLGMSPIQAIQIASVNVARHFHLDHELGSLAPGRYADIVLCDSLSMIRPWVVFCRGKMVAREGELLEAPPAPAYPGWLLNTVHLPGQLGPDSFRVEARGKRALVRVMEIDPNQILNRQVTEWLQVNDGAVTCDPERDILKIAAVERYGREGGVGIGFVRGFGLRRGALASSVAHDHHNVVVVGSDDGDMYRAVKEVERNQGGLVVAAGGEVVASLPLPLAGLMSPLSPDELARALDRLNASAAALGCRLPAPFMTLSFVSLPTVPDLGLSDRGLIDVRRRCLVPAVIEDPSSDRR